MKLSVIIPTFNPNKERLESTLRALDLQTLDASSWECILVDNNSSPPVDPIWCRERFGKNLRVVREPKPGLSHARLAGITHAKGEILVFSDDDNLFSTDYLEIAVSHMDLCSKVGVAGGKSLPLHLAPVPSWYVEGMAPLGCRDLGDEILNSSSDQFRRERSYPPFSPIGAGMVFRREAVSSWATTVGKSGISDRKGKSLSSAGDCDIVLHALASGYDVAYWPGLVLHHLLPPQRVTESYLAAISRAAFRDFVKVLDIHGIRPWPRISHTTVWLRSVRAWLSHKAWRGPAERISWQSSVGQFEGRATLDS